MAKEIEHKYFVVNDSFLDYSHERTEIAQGYLSRDPERTVRVRRIDNKGFLTVKGRNSGDTRMEFEYEIPAEDADLILAMCDGDTIQKTRYNVMFEGYKWEVDVFHGNLTGLIMAEVELCESHHNYPLPPFVGPEMTDDKRCYNSVLPVHAAELIAELDILRSRHRTRTEK